MNPAVEFVKNSATTRERAQIGVEAVQTGFVALALGAGAHDPLDVALHVDDAVSDADAQLPHVKPVADDHLAGADENVFIVEHAVTVAGQLRVDKGGDCG